MAGARKRFVEEVAEKLGMKERIEPGDILKWDGEKLYVTDKVFRGDHKVGNRTRDVTDEIKKLLKAKK
jgi:hypothetical protein